jgi:hypothetical protein
MQELCLLWRLPNGTTCTVLRAGEAWELQIKRLRQLMYREFFADGHVLIERAKELRLVYEAVA